MWVECVKRTNFRILELSCCYNLCSNGIIYCNFIGISYVDCYVNKPLIMTYLNLTCLSFPSPYLSLTLTMPFVEHGLIMAYNTLCDRTLGHASHAGCTV